MGSPYFPGSVPLLNERTVLYFEQGEHPLLNLLLKKHYRQYHDQCRKNGFTFIYLPGLEDLDASALENLSNQLQYLYPRYYSIRQKGILSLLHLLFDFYPGTILYRRFQDILGRLDYPESGFLIFDSEVILGKKPLCRKLEFAYHEEDANKVPEPEEALHQQLLNFFVYGLSNTRIRSSNIRFSVEAPRFSFPADSISEFSLKIKENDPEDRFDEELKKVNETVRMRLIQMLNSGKESILLNLMIQFFNQVGVDNPALLREIEKLLEIKEGSATENQLSPIRLQAISGGYDYRILLPDYDLEILMTPLCKTLYLFFLMHSEGVKLKHLIDYDHELQKIYRKLSKLSDTDVISDNIHRLTDVVNDNSIHVNCARIKSAFLEKMTDSVARNYYITGKRGYPKKVALATSLVTIDPMLLDLVN